MKPISFHYALSRVHHVIKLYLPTVVYIMSKKKLETARVTGEGTVLLKVEECVDHVVKCCDCVGGIDKTLPWRLIFPMSLGTLLDSNCAASHD